MSVLKYHRGPPQKKIFVKSDIGYFHETLSRVSKFG